ncbi:MAG: hypothetical protein WCT53_03345 [Candidatus Gracilibacteria bacterium]
MADDQKPSQAGADPAQQPPPKSQEAGAQDLLSMWGSQSAKPQVPEKNPDLEPKPEPAKVAEVARPQVKPLKPLKKPEAPTPKPKPEPLKDKKEDEVIEGEIVTERKVTKPAIEKVKEELVKPVEENEIEFDEEEDSIASQIEEFLRELNLSPRKIFTFIGVIVLIGVLIFGGISGYKYFKNRSAKQVTVEQPKPPTDISSEQSGISTVSNIGKIAEITTEMVGATGIASTTSIGKEEEGATELADYVLTFRQLQNAYAVNLNELLNKSINRRQTLENHLAVLRNLYNESKDKNTRLIEDITKIQAQYGELQVKQDADDKQFFEQMNALNPQATQDSLSDFILVSREMTALKARFKALQKIQSFYGTGLNKFALRIRDIELNAEPLIAGIKVYDVTGSDISLIVPIAVEGAQADKLSTSGNNDVKFLPIGVSDIKTNSGADYITQPEPKRPAATTNKK